MSFLGNKAFELVKEIRRTHKDGIIAPFNEATLRAIFEEMTFLADKNFMDTTTAGNSRSVVPALWFRHTILERLQRCVLVYLYHRLTDIRDVRWLHACILPRGIRRNVTEQEEQFFFNYNRLLANYMRSIGSEDSIERGLDLTVDLVVPRTRNIYVRPRKNWEMETDRGDILKLKKDTICLVPEQRALSLVREGVFQDYDNRPFRTFMRSNIF